VVKEPPHEVVIEHRSRAVPAVMIGVGLAAVATATVLRRSVPPARHEAARGSAESRR